MLSQLATRVGPLRQCVQVQLKRNIGFTAIAAQKANLDPIQQMFVDKVRAYAQKSKAAGGKLIDATSGTENNLKDQLNKIERQFNATGKDMTQFPTFNFVDLGLMSPGVDVDPKDNVAKGIADERPEEVEEEEKAYFDF